jgi:hypothetical protein
LRCNHSIKNKKIKNLLHTRAKARLPLNKHLKPVFVKKKPKNYTKNIIKFFTYFIPDIKNGFFKINLLYNIIGNYIKISKL